MKRHFALLLASFALLPWQALDARTVKSAALPALQTGQHPQPSAAGGYPFQLFLPRAYDPAAHEDWPVMVFLHGSGEAGADIEKVKAHGPPKIVGNDPDFPFILISPQLPEGEDWSPAKLDIMLDAILPRLKADRRRIYLTGLSLGGMGTWAWALARPDRFAAIAPVAASGDSTRACTIKTLPAWVFHGDGDTDVPTTEDFAMVEAMRKCGGSPRLTIYPGTGHWSWEAAYGDAALYYWLLHQRRAAN